jgi:phosphoribosyl-AMP cyclohydrolase
MKMEFIINAKKMKQLMETVDDTPVTFVSTQRDEEIVKGIEIMKSMGVRKIEVDLSEDDCNLLH